MITRRQMLKWALASSAVPQLLGSVASSASSKSSVVEQLILILEQTPRDKLKALLVAEMSRGMSDKDLFTAVCLAAVRNIEPYPSVGFKYHAVMMMQSVQLTRDHWTSLNDRWLPLLWSADQFKAAQRQDLAGGDWTMEAVDAKVSSPGDAFIRAMESWDAPAADQAIVAMSRAQDFDMHAVFELLFRYGARDLRDIGHKTITVSNCYRVLDVIGWQHRESMLRSTVYALLNHTNETNPATSDLVPDRAGRINTGLLTKLPADWQQGRIEHSATLEFYQVLVGHSPEEIGRFAVDLLADGIHPQVLWDAVFMAVAQLIMYQSSIVMLHATTTINALNFAYRQAKRGDTRAFLLLQGLSFATLFRNLLRGRERSILFDTFEPVAPDDRQPLEEIFFDISENRERAASKVLHYLNNGGSVDQFMRVARSLIVDMNSGSHDYKFAEAAFENYHHISMQWRNRYLSASAFYLNGSEDKPNPVVADFKELLQWGQSQVPE